MQIISKNTYNNRAFSVYPNNFTRDRYGTIARIFNFAKCIMIDMCEHT